MSDFDGSGTDSGDEEISLDMGGVGDLPDGTYFIVIDKVEMRPSKVKGTPGLHFTCSVLEPDEHVNQKIWGSVWLTPGSMFMVKRALESITGQNWDQNNMTLNTADLRGETAHVIVTSTPYADENGTMKAGKPQISDWMPKKENTPF